MGSTLDRSHCLPSSRPSDDFVTKSAGGHFRSLSLGQTSDHQVNQLLFQRTRYLGQRKNVRGRFRNISDRLMQLQQSRHKIMFWSNNDLERLFRKFAPVMALHAASKSLWVRDIDPQLRSAPFRRCWKSVFRTIMLPSEASWPQYTLPRSLVRNEIALRTGLTVPATTCGRFSRPRCIQSWFKLICISSARNSPFTVGKISTSEMRRAA